MNLWDFHLGKRIEHLTFALLSKRKQRLPDSIMVVQLILVQFVLVRIQVGQQKPFDKRRVFYFDSAPAYSS